jgi:hypothetical protein
MASELIRDPAKDHLLTPKNSALIIIDYQPVQVNSIAPHSLKAPRCSTWHGSTRSRLPTSSWRSPPIRLPSGKASDPAITTS